MWDDDDNDGFKDDYLWDVEHGYYGEAEDLLDERKEDDDDDDFCELDEFEISELEDAGIDIEEFELLDDDEKRRVIIRAGLDPEFFDFF